MSGLHSYAYPTPPSVQSPCNLQFLFLSAPGRFSTRRSATCTCFAPQEAGVHRNVLPARLEGAIRGQPRCLGRVGHPRSRPPAVPPPPPPAFKVGAVFFWALPGTVTLQLQISIVSCAVHGRGSALIVGSNAHAHDSTGTHALNTNPRHPVKDLDVIEESPFFVSQIISQIKTMTA